MTVFALVSRMRDALRESCVHVQISGGRLYDVSGELVSASQDPDLWTCSLCEREGASETHTDDCLIQCAEHWLEEERKLRRQGAP